MRYLSPALILLATLAFHAPAAHAIPMTFVASLNSANENNPLDMSTGTGFATVVLDTDPAVHTIRAEVTFSGLTSGTTASHIHCCETTPGANANVMVATTTPSFPNFPPGLPPGTPGNYDMTFDLLAASTYNPLFVTSAFNPSGTVAGAEAALVAGIQNRETYLNIHTTMFPSGEIRGTLVAAPEPASLVLLGSALFGLGLIRRRKLFG